MNRISLAVSRALPNYVRDGAGTILRHEDDAREAVRQALINRVANKLLDSPKWYQACSIEELEWMLR